MGHSKKGKEYRKVQRRMARQKPSDQTGCRQLDPEAKPETMEMNELERAVPAERGGNINYLRKELAVAYSTIFCLKHTIQRLHIIQRLSSFTEEANAGGHR